MGTRGFVGFVADGKTAIAYNHSDSYPGALGSDVLTWLRTADLSVAKTQAAALRVVAPHSETTDDDVRALRKYHNPHVGGPSERPTWYQLLRGTQGDPAAILDAGAVEDASSFPADSGSAEYGFIVDFDGARFEAYEGFQKEHHAAGRFARSEPDRYGCYPVKLVGSWPLDALPDDDTFFAAFDADAE